MKLPDKGGVILVDLGGVLIPSRKGMPAPTSILQYEPFADARNVLRKLRDMGYVIKLFTARANPRHPAPDSEADIRAWIKRSRLPIADITTEKEPNCMVIDDRAVVCEAGEDPQWWRKFGIRLAFETTPHA